MNKIDILTPEKSSMQGAWKLSMFLTTSKKVNRVNNWHLLVCERGENSCPHNKRDKHMKKGSHGLPGKRMPQEAVPW